MSCTAVYHFQSDLWWRGKGRGRQCRKTPVKIGKIWKKWKKKFFFGFSNFYGAKPMSCTAVYHFQSEISTLDLWIVLCSSPPPVIKSKQGRRPITRDAPIRCTAEMWGKKVPAPPRAAGCSGQHATRARTPLRLTPASGFFNSFPYSHKHDPGIEVGLLGNVWRIKENQPAQNNTWEPASRQNGSEK